MFISDGRYIHIWNSRNYSPCLLILQSSLAFQCMTFWVYSLFIYDQREGCPTVVPIAMQFWSPPTAEYAVIKTYRSLWYCKLYWGILCTLMVSQHASLGGINLIFVVVLLSAVQMKTYQTKNTNFKKKNKVYVVHCPTAMPFTCKCHQLSLLIQTCSNIILQV